MADIANLGFSIDSSQLDSAAASLQKLVPASAAAEAAAESVTGALEDTSAAAVAVTNAAKGTTTQTTATSKVITAAAGAINTNTAANKSNAAAAGTAANSNNNLAHSHQGLSTQAMAAQHSIRSMIEGLASGMPVSNVLTQQLNHLSYAASGPGGITGAFSEALGMFTKLISGWVLLAAAAAGVVVGFGLIARSVISSELALDDLSKSSNLTLTQLNALEQAASFKGINTDDITKAINSFAQGINDAKHNMGDLNGLLIANNIQSKDFATAFASVADLVQKTTDGQQRINILQAAGLPTTAAFVRFMAQGGDAITAAMNATVGFNEAAEKNLVQKARDFDDAWNKVTTNFKNNFKSAFVDILNGFDTMAQKATQFGNLSVWSKITELSGKLGLNSTPESMGIQPLASAPDGKPITRVQITGGTTAPQPPASANPQTQAQQLKANSDDQARISILGDLATVQQQGYAKQLQLNAAGLQGVGVNDTMQKKIVLATTAQAEQTRVNSQAAAGIFDMQSAQKAASDTLQHWIDQGLVDQNNAQQMAAAHLVLARNIQATSDAAAVAAAPLQQLKQLELDGSNLAKSLDTATTSALNNLVQPIQDMMNGVTGLSAGFKNLGVVVLQAIQQMIIKMLILTPIAKALQAVMGGIFPGLGLFSSAAAGPTSLGSPAGPSPLVANALGGVYNSPSLSAFSGQVVTQPTLFKFASGAGLMGEAGAEGILPLKRGPSGAMGVQMFGNGSSSNDNSATTTHVTYAPVYQVGGTASQKDLDDLKAAQQQSDREFSSKVVGTIGNMRKHNVRV